MSAASAKPTIWPFAVAYYVEATLVSAWCELRDDFRHFRVDRVQALEGAGATHEPLSESIQRIIEDIDYQI